MNEPGPHRVRQLRVDPPAEAQIRWLGVGKIGPVHSIGQVQTVRRLAYMLKRFLKLPLFGHATYCRVLVDTTRLDGFNLTM